jgi:hypothetical protein
VYACPAPRELRCFPLHGSPLPLKEATLLSCPPTPNIVSRFHFNHTSSDVDRVTRLRERRARRRRPTAAVAPRSRGVPGGWTHSCSEFRKNWHHFFRAPPNRRRARCRYSVEQSPRLLIPGIEWKRGLVGIGQKTPPRLFCSGDVDQYVMWFYKPHDVRGVVQARVGAQIFSGLRATRLVRKEAGVAEASIPMSEPEDLVAVWSRRPFPRAAELWTSGRSRCCLPSPQKLHGWSGHRRPGSGG